MGSSTSKTDSTAMTSRHLCVPGFGLPVDYTGGKQFPCAIQGRWDSQGITLREKRMMALISSITDKPEWDRKVFDDAIVARWRAEADATTMPQAPHRDVFMSEKMFDFVSLRHRGGGGWTSWRSIEG